MSKQEKTETNNQWTSVSENPNGFVSSKNKPKKSETNNQWTSASEGENSSR